MFYVIVLVCLNDSNLWQFLIKSFRIMDRRFVMLSDSLDVELLSYHEQHVLTVLF